MGVLLFVQERDSDKALSFIFGLIRNYGALEFKIWFCSLRTSYEHNPTEPLLKSCISGGESSAFEILEKIDLRRVAWTLFPEATAHMDLDMSLHAEEIALVWDSVLFAELLWFVLLWRLSVQSGSRILLHLSRSDRFAVEREQSSTALQFRDLARC